MPASLALTLFPCPTSRPRIGSGLVGIAPGRDGAKDAARGMAIRHWPQHAELFALGLAEAALVGLAGLPEGAATLTRRED